MGVLLFNGKKHNKRYIVSFVTKWSVYRDILHANQFYSLSNHLICSAGGVDDHNVHDQIYEQALPFTSTFDSIFYSWL